MLEISLFFERKLKSIIPGDRKVAGDFFVVNGKTNVIDGSPMICFMLSHPGKKLIAL